MRRESQSVEGRAGRTRHRPPAWAIAAHRHAPPARLDPRPRCCRAQVRARRAEITSVRGRAVRARVAAVARPRGRTTLIRRNGCPARDEIPGYLRPMEKRRSHGCKSQFNVYSDDTIARSPRDEHLSRRPVQCPPVDVEDVSASFAGC